ncbi:Inner membrane protein PPF-1, chloroplastic [Linum perenne]
MAKTLISYPTFLGTPLPARSRHGLLHTLPTRRLISTTVKMSLQDIPPVSSIDLSSIVTRAESALYTLADAAVAVGSASGGAASSSGDEAVQKSGGWFGFISDAMEFVLKILEDGLTAVHVPYAYGFSIILLTVLVKLATLPLTKQQASGIYVGDAEPSTKDKSNPAKICWQSGCLPTLATIPVWIGLYQALSNVANEGLLTEGFFWIPSLGGPTSIAARQSGSGTSWLFPFVDGHPPLGWGDTAAYLVLPVLLIVSQYVSMEIMKPPQTDDPTQKNTLLIFKFLPLMIGYFSLSVPSGLTIYWFTNNVLSTAQQVWLRQLGGAKPAVNEDASGIITAGRAKRSVAQPGQPGERSKQFRDEEKKKKFSKALPLDALDSASGSEEDSDDERRDKGEEVLEEAYASRAGKQLSDISQPKRSKRSKRKRTA